MPYAFILVHQALLLHRQKTLLLLYFCLLAVLPSNGQVLTTDVHVHDPVIIREDSTYYVYCTGHGIAVWSSKDMVYWKPEPRVFKEPPKWAVDSVKDFKNHIWAPDISLHNGVYYLYYTVSTFGKNTSCIGLATNRTLNPSSPLYHWQDYGMVLQSRQGRDAWNAIDPNLIEDKDGTPYLAFGSFWSGLKLVKLTEDRRHLANPTDSITTIASRRNAANPKAANPIEAPFIYRNGDYFYLFASIDYCCKGVNSTYKMIVGRARKLQGPYVDAAGKPMTSGGGTVLLAGDKDWHGVGHCAVARLEGKDYLVFHGYDAADNGASKLRIFMLSWQNGWPVVEAAK